MTRERLELVRLGGLDEARTEWRRLADAAGNPFTTWEWASTWWRHYGDGRELLLTGCRTADGMLAAILPLYAGRAGGVRAVRLVGHGPADQLGPVCAAGDASPATAALRDALDEGIGDWQAALIERLPGDSGAAEALGGTVVRREPSPVLEHDGDFESFLASRSRNFRDQVRRRERRLRRGHEVRFRLTQNHDELDRDFAKLVELHHARWGDASSAFAPARVRFHRDFAGAALDNGWLRLWTLELDDAPAAAWLGYRLGGAEWYYQAGRDPVFEREAIGFVLMAHTVRAALDDGMRRYELLLGDESYKDRFATADHGLETVVLGRGLRGRAAVAAARAAAGAPPAIRRRVLRSVG